MSWEKVSRAFLMSLVLAYKMFYWFTYKKSCSIGPSTPDLNELKCLVINGHCVAGFFNNPFEAEFKFIIAKKTSMAAFCC